MVALWLHWNCNHKSKKCNSQKRVKQIGIYFVSISIASSLVETKNTLLPLLLS